MRDFDSKEGLHPEGGFSEGEAHIDGEGQGQSPHLGRESGLPQVELRLGWGGTLEFFQLDLVVPIQVAELGLSGVASLGPGLHGGKLVQPVRPVLVRALVQVEGLQSPDLGEGLVAVRTEEAGLLSGSLGTALIPAEFTLALLESFGLAAFGPFGRIEGVGPKVVCWGSAGCTDPIGVDGLSVVDRLHLDALAFLLRQDLLPLRGGLFP